VHWVPQGEVLQVLKKVHVMLDPLNPSSTETVMVEDLLAHLKERFGDRFPDNGHIYHEVISIDHEVTPRCERDIDLLASMEGTFYVVVYPGANVVVGLIIAVVVAAATYFLTPTPPPIPVVAQRNQQTASPNNELSERENRPRINGRIPDIFGTVRSTPDLIAATYTMFENGREVEYAYMCIGRGWFEVSDIRDGETLCENIPGTSVAIYEPFTSPNSGDSPQLLVGNPITNRVLNVKRSNSVNGQVLRPPNNAALIGNDNIIFAYPNRVLAPVNSGVDFTQYFSADSEITISGASQGAVSEIIGLSNIGFYGTVFNPLSEALYGASFAGGGYFYFSSLDGIIPPGIVVGATVTIDQDQDTSIGAYKIWNTNAFAHVTGSAADMRGTFEIAEVKVVDVGWEIHIAVRLVDPASVNANWGLYGRFQPVGGPTQLGVITTTFGYDFPAFNLDGVYIALSVSTNEIILANAASVSADWLLLEEPVYTPPLSPTMTTSGLKYIGPYILDEEDANSILANFIAPNGLYKDDGVDQVAASVTIRVEVQPVDASDENIGSPESFDSSLTVSNSLKETVAATLKGTFQWFTGRCAVRAARTSFADEDFEGTVVDEVRWRDLYSVAPVVQEHFGNVTTVMSRTFATASALALKKRQLNMLVQRKLPVRTSGSEFDDEGLVATNRADAIFCAICRDRYLGNRAIAEIDVTQIYDTVTAVEAYFGTTDAVEFCYTFDNDNMSFEEMADLVAGAVFCTPYRRGSVIQLAFEHLTTDASILFNHRNKIPGTEKRSFVFGTLDENDGLEYTYVNPEDDSIISVFLPEGTPSSNPKKIESIGVRNHLQAYFHAWRIWNKMQYQNELVEFDATQEAMLLVKNDRFLCTDGTRAGSQEGEVVEVDGLTLTLSQNVDLVTDPPYTIFLQLSDGTTQAIGVTAGSAANQVVLAGAPSVALVTDSRSYARTAYMIGGDNDPRQTAFLLTEKSANRGLVSTVKAINYDPRYYQNDSDFANGVIGGGGYGPDGGYSLDVTSVYTPSAPGGSPEPAMLRVILAEGSAIPEFTQTHGYNPEVIIPALGTLIEWNPGYLADTHPNHFPVFGINNSTGQFTFGFVSESGQDMLVNLFSQLVLTGPGGFTRTFTQGTEFLTNMNFFTNWSVWSYTPVSSGYEDFDLNNTDIYTLTIYGP
jgi:hypothetical protein